MKNIAILLVCVLLAGCAEEYVEANYWAMHTIEGQLQGAPYQDTSWSGTWVEPQVNQLFIKIAVGQIDGEGAADFAIGAKSDTKPARLLWYQSPPNPTIENVVDWRAHEIADIDWADSLEIVDINGDGSNDVLLGYWHHLAWYENPGNLSAGAGDWRQHTISTTTNSYFARCDETEPAVMRWVVGADISGAVPGDTVAWLIRKDLDNNANWEGGWRQQRITTTDVIPRDPSKEEYWVKSIACGNIDDDPRLDIIMSISGFGHGVFALLNLADEPGDQSLRLQTISSALPSSRKGLKYDDIRLADIDLDGDLDIVTTEENGSENSWWSTQGLGLIWYENPGRPL